MTTTPEPAPSGQQERSSFDTVARDYALQVWVALLGVGAALALTVIVLAITKGLDALTLEIWLGGLALVFVGTGLGYFWSRQAEDTKDLARGDVLRLTALAVVGLCGFVTFVYGVLLIGIDYPTVFLGKIDVLRENVRIIVLCVLPLFVGLALMYAGLALGGKFERTQPAVRRLMYGYNAVLGGLLLLAILVVLNLLSYTHVKPFSALGSTLDWTSSGIYTLQEGSRQVLTNLKEPVEVKVILRRSNPIMPDVELLLENCRRVNPEIRWQIVSPDDEDNNLRELLKSYPITSEGLLVLYGQPGAQVGEFIKGEDLLNVPPFNPRDPDAASKVSFQGEFALIKTLSYLEEGRTHTTVYFTQGNGELDFNDASSMGRDQGLGVLAEQLSKGNYDLLQGAAADLPEKADVVVLAGPRKPFTPEAVAALRKFLKRGGGKKPGKLFVLFDLAVVDDKLVKTGLEELLAEYSVTVGENRILSVKRPNPREVIVMPHLGGTNPIPKGFYTSEGWSQFIWFNARTIQPAPPNPARTYATEVLFETNPSYLVWAEDNFRTEPAELVNELRTNREKLVERISKTPLPVAVAVSESGGGLPPGHPGAGEQKPILLAFGDASWVANREIQSRENLNLFTSCVAWLRERPEIGQMPSPPQRPTYQLNVTEEQQGRMFWLPGALILLTIISLSLGVWLVRRR